MSLHELRDKRGQIVADARALLEKAETEKRALSVEEEKTYDTLMSEQSKLKSTIEREIQLREVEREALQADVKNSKQINQSENISAEIERYRNYLLGNLPKNALQTDSNKAGGILVPTQVVEHIP